MNTSLVDYYQQRATDYESIYHKPERQQDIATATTILQNIFIDKQVLEIACGTGFWTEKIAAVASAIHATDINQSVIDIAKQKHYAKANVSFELADFFQYQTAQPYNSLFGGFIWSHILLQEIPTFIATIQCCVAPGGTVVFMDNNFVTGSNLPITHTDAAGNTFQKRQLADGSTHLVLKNFSTETFIKNKLEKVASEVNFIHLKYYWILVYKTNS
ncbi:class I SAM-dependent methyltransferase [Ilyomonas limi]|uniref:Class I SAM-dependent methyltransferase n=1 Tax=Ilyomonas limi TaxID=2575867 RepID=A0A4U3KX57_9BACT|nr:class I SAM-dependent methyltransferase [Ilyomonas limi]TKK67191.1 class I SAM-dependent methyltransferase [Ilyomonas limi]